MGYGVIMAEGHRLCLLAPHIEADDGVVGTGMVNLQGGGIGLPEVGKLKGYAGMIVAEGYHAWGTMALDGAYPR